MWLIGPLQGEANNDIACGSLEWWTGPMQGGVPAGMLTSQGKDQAYMLGRRLAERYSQLIDKEFNPQQV